LWTTMNNRKTLPNQKKLLTIFHRFKQFSTERFFVVAL
jgi:hypothetical protein